MTFLASVHGASYPASPHDDSGQVSRRFRWGSLSLPGDPSSIIFFHLDPRIIIISDVAVNLAAAAGLSILFRLLLLLGIRVQGDRSGVEPTARQSNRALPINQELETQDSVRVM